jgi:hypothetical protein
MLRCLLWMLVWASLVFFPLRADTVPLVVVSNRQYLVQGDSTIHLYLYGLDGKLRKQLTNDPGQDDHGPMFSHDGKSILFSRVTTGAGLPNQSGKYILSLADGSTTRVPDGAPTDAALKDYAPTTDTLEFSDLAFENNALGDNGQGTMTLTSPDKSYELIEVRTDTTSTHQLKSPGSSKLQLVSSFPGYSKITDDYMQDTFLSGKDGPFLLGPKPYGALFVNRHRDSMWVLDLYRKTWHKIQPEWVPGDIYAPRNKGGFYFVRCSMEPLGSTGKTVLSAYLEWWDARFHSVRLSPPLSATYGAATYYGPGDTSYFVDEQRGS